MFNIFKFRKSNDERIYAPLKGKCIDISEVQDEGFASKLMGDGLAFDSEDTLLRSPCNGKITMFFGTKHALGIEADNGMELLIHVGIDTVNENGKGFTALKKVNDRIRIGDPLLKFDYDYLKQHYDMTTMLIITNQVPVKKMSLNTMVDNQSCILEKTEDCL